MKILRKRDYDDLIKQIKNAENQTRDQKKFYENKQDELEKKIKDLELDKNNLISKEEKLTKSLKSMEDIVVSKDIKIEKLNKQIADISKKKHSLSSRIGGLKKENNKLKDEVKDKNQKIENLKEDFRKNHRKLTVNQYDKRLKVVNKKEN